MAKIKEKQLALELRMAGNSYSQIKAATKVSKSTLSYWLRDYPLPPEKIHELRDLNAMRIERYRETRRKQKEATLAEVYKEQKNNIIPLSPRDLFIGGLFLYWGEGAKTDRAEISLSNSNPTIVRAFIKWLRYSMKIDTAKMIVKLQLYSDMNVGKETQFWSEKLDIPETQFKKPYIKQSKFSSITYKNGFGHGTCNLVVRSAMLQNKVFQGLKVFTDYFQK